LQVSHDAHATTTTASSQGSPQFDLDTGVLSLDFTNTLEHRINPPVVDRINTYADLLAFSRESGVLDDAHAVQLADAATRQPDLAASALERALAVREALFRLFSALAAGETPIASDLATLNMAHAAASAHGRIVLHGEHFDWAWDDDPAALDRPLWPIVRAAVTLLLEGDLGRVRQCAAHDCAWLFLDTSRNHSRRWCSMSSCGNRAKVGNFRERRKDGARPAS
jgi:predicted RNA-binding Zn ribbon-like protein